MATSPKMYNPPHPGETLREDVGVNRSSLSGTESIHPSRKVVLTHVEASDGIAPVLWPFLDILAHDIAAHPERLQAIDASFMRRIQSLAGGIEVDLDTTLPR